MGNSLLSLSSQTLGKLYAWTLLDHTLSKAKMGKKLTLCVSDYDRLSFQLVEIVELPVTTEAVIPMDTKGQKGIKTQKNIKLPYFDKSSAMISKLVNKTWFSHYPRCQYIIYDNGNEFKLHFEALCEPYGIKRKPTSVKNPQANAILERVHQVITTMLCTTELDMANTVVPSDIDAFLIMQHGPFGQLTIPY